MEITISIDRIYVTLKGDADDLRELQLPDLPPLGPLLADALTKGDARVKVEAVKAEPKPFIHRHGIPMIPEERSVPVTPPLPADAEGFAVLPELKVSHRANTCWAQGEDKLSNKARALRLVAAKRMTKDALQDEILDKDYSTTKGGAYALAHSFIRDGLAVLEDVEGGEPVLVLTEAGKQAAMLPEGAR